MIAFFLIALLQLKVPDAQQIVGPPAARPLAGAELDKRTAEIAQLLRCPVCQGLAIGDSPSIMAMNMKEQVRELLARGYSQEQILKYFEQSYGQFVLLKPKFQGVNALVWILPLAALLLGLGLILMKMNKLERPPPAAAAPADDPYLARVRELVEK
ncbi:MAG TPA: cytochrome c-type biogenesis protein CcmH [Thermoanaerobaculia bacterium]|jgi:cytochrome c-type biogenesis protein CcmH|nr:cytochrome c-type biogenesis protein CcmH [Thermoanaerobaculia bacterium]